MITGRRAARGIGWVVVVGAGLRAEFARIAAEAEEEYQWIMKKIGYSDVRKDFALRAIGRGERSGLLTASYHRKPAFGAYRALIARYGARQLSSPVAHVGRAN